MGHALVSDEDYATKKASEALFVGHVLVSIKDPAKKEPLRSFLWAVPLLSLQILQWRIL